MCRFCDALFNSKINSISVEPRSRGRLDNICYEYCPYATIAQNGNGIECGGQCLESFWIEGYVNNDSKYFILNYMHKVNNLNIEVFSNSIPIMYCFICGKKLSEDNLDDLDSHKFTYIDLHED
ncbi:hypothetical protein [Metaclostridioides mangenotii]|uniref:hypothetical protein n=1 Tax=Metaclostridioides mangenotii TaxID=1540 RepID=UPI0004656CD7|nr:hypothetical protein [Clostridioides mangenotii]